MRHVSPVDHGGVRVVGGWVWRGRGGGEGAGAARVRGPPQDLARLSRWMAGKAVGLVLSGGGSRGLAHLGVLHALDTAGIPIDVVGGTSQATTPPRLGALQPAATYRAGSRGEGGGGCS